MPISGPVIHQQLMDAYANVETNLESARGQFLDSDEQRDDLNARRGEALISLAEHYLPELTRDAVRETWFEIRATVSQILVRKENHLRNVQETLNELASQRHGHDERLIEINHQLDLAMEAQQEVAGRVEQQLQKDQQFMQLSDRAAVAEASLERAESNLQEIEQDAARKLPAYDNSALFRYLYDRRYGTRQYTHRGFTRRMDRWLAQYIRFDQAKQGYEFLRKTPEQMRQIIAEDREAFDTVMNEIERARDEVAAQFGLPAKIDSVREIQGQREDHLRLLDNLWAETEAAQNEIRELEDTRGPYYREAIKVFREMLESRDSGDLWRRAEQTVEITDDQIVARLKGVEAELDEVDETDRRRRLELDQAHSFLEDLGRLLQRFRAAEFDSSRSQFVGSLDIFQEVDEAQESGHVDLLWKHIRDAQRWGPTAMEKMTRIATHPMTQVLINAMAHAAGAALESHARRAGDRRAGRDASWRGSRRGDRRY